MLSNPIPYDLCVGVPISHLLSVGSCQFSIVSNEFLKCESTNRRFQPEDPSRGLSVFLRDFENIAD